MANEMIIERAKSAEMSHDFDTAARLYKQLLQQDSTNVKYLSALGRIFVTAGEDKKAIPYFEQIHTYHPKDVDAMDALGAIYRRLGRYEDSTAILMKALETGEKQQDVFYNLGFTFKEMKNYEDAIDAFENVISVNPRDVLAHNHLGSIYYETGELDKAVNAYKRGLQIDPNHPILHYNLARTYTKLKNYPDAIRGYEAALKTRPNWPEAIRHFSNLLIKCQKSVEAARIVKQSIKIHPNDPELLYSLGQVYLNQFDYDNAKKTFKQANAVKSNDVKILTALASAYEKADESDKALSTILNAIDLEPLNNDVRLQYVDTLLSVNDYNSAFETIESMNGDSDGKDVKVMDLYGQYYITQGQDDKAEEYFDKIKKTDHHYKDYMLGASKRYAQLEKYDNAERFAKDYVKSRGTRAEGYNMLGKIYTMGGRYAEAQAAYEQGVAVNTPNVYAVKGIENVKRLQSIPLEGLSEVKEEKQELSPEDAQTELKADEILDEDFDVTSFGDDVGIDEPLDEMASIADQLKDEDFDIFDDMDREEADLEPLATDELMDAIGNADSQEPENTLKPEGNDDFSGIIESAQDEGQEDFALDSVPVAEEVPLEDEGDAFPAEMPPAQPQTEPEPAPAPAAQPAPAMSAMPDMSAAMQAQLDALARATKTAQDALQFAMDAENRVKEMEEKLEAEDEAVEVPAAEEVEPEAEAVEEPVVEEEPAAEEDMPFEEPDLAEEETRAAEEETQLAQEEPELAEDEAEIEEEASEEDFAEPAEDEIIEESADELISGEMDEPAEDMVEEADDSEFALAPTDDSNFDGDFDAELNENLDTTPFTNVIELYAELLATYGDLDDTDAAEQLTDLEEQIASGEVIVSESQDKGEEEEDFNPPAESPATGNENSAQLAEVAEMLKKIEAILSDDALALKYSSEISMLKRLKVLCEYLPDDEKISFASGRIRMLIDYLLAKMSGKPGLLLTTKSLLKSGILGNEYRVQLISECEEELNNEMLRRVLVYMKDLSESLDDFGLSAALRACADGALEKIEMINQKSQIF
ncbi:lipopolysaccharide assembly protein LapB [Treponema sp. C6A8]|uniref:tetratricopeptide repeat protein n=1 Tax=Treponema sp. C6A8 TaxID=1410609 RepID=UPI000487709F|nr:tetratricopeptide repeat protein [Treponema sp. C6A8]